jgi:DMSO/TMAO reductase YedYZ molybdopterin-dependent catalytic subunit
LSTVTIDNVRRDLLRETARRLGHLIPNERFFVRNHTRTPTIDPAPGASRCTGAACAARWRGVPLRELLDRAGLRRGAVDVLAEGLDDPYVTGGVDYGRVRRPVSIEKALDDTVVALEMNGRTLPADHGFPARLLVPAGSGSRASSGSAGSRCPTSRSRPPGTRSGTRA